MRSVSIRVTLRRVKPGDPMEPAASHDRRDSLVQGARSPHSWCFCGSQRQCEIVAHGLLMRLFMGVRCFASPSVLALAVLCAVGCSMYDQELLDPTGSGAALNADAREPEGPLQHVAAVTPQATEDAAVSHLPRCATPTSADCCTSLAALPDEPVIDGTLECGLTLAPIAPLGWNSTAAMPDNRASYAAALRPDGIYLYVEVHALSIATHAVSDPLFCGDAVELYVDAQPHPEAPSTYGAATMQFVVSAPASPEAPPEAARFVAGAPQGAWISHGLRTTQLPDGYSVEAFITAADVGLWQWSPASHVAFGLAVDVSGAPGDPALHCGQQLGQYFLKLGTPAAGCRGEPWCDVTAFCAPASQP